MTNYEIVLIVHDKFDLIQLIKKQICTCVPTNTCEDLEQLLYVKLMGMDNYKLNELYHKNELNKYLSQTIKNQRNYYASEYQKIGRLHFQNITVELDDIEIKEQDTHDYTIDVLWNIIENNHFGWTGQTQEEMRTSMSYQIYKLYLKQKISMKTLGEQFGMCRSTCNTLIKHAKETIRKEYDIYIKNNDIEKYSGS